MVGVVASDLMKCSQMVQAVGCLAYVDACWNKLSRIELCIWFPHPVAVFGYEVPLKASMCSALSTQDITVANGTSPIILQRFSYHPVYLCLTNHVTLLLWLRVAPSYLLDGMAQYGLDDGDSTVPLY